VYTAAIEDGVKPDDTIVDAPVSFGGYAPHNYENDFKGRMTIANAFAESRNVPAIKLAARVGIHKVIDMAHRFGVTSNIPAYLPIALGAVEISLDEQVASYSVFPNDGERVTPHLVRKVSNADGITLWEDRPEVSQVIDQQTARTMMTLLRGVTQHGTGATAAQLNHPIGGKTGTTSDFTDAWFLGFSPSVTCGVWIGFDSRESLGEKETGAKAALPIWITFMRAAIAGKPDEQFPGDDGSDQLLKAQVTPLTIVQPTSQASAKPVQPVTTGKPAGVAQAPLGTPTPAKTVTQTATKPAAKLTEATDVTPRVKPALTAEPMTANPRGVVKPAIANHR
jgi:penicillin-binding protein 1A